MMEVMVLPWSVLVWFSWNIVVSSLLRIWQTGLTVEEGKEDGKGSENSFHVE